ncbi:MAG: amidohydrolase family protein [Chloroflexi bacterium]|nr:amidohydrolase family protein [Chloroflexota bacterium]
MLDLTAIPIVDHHVHSLLRRQPRTLPAYLRLFTESDDPKQVARHVPHTVFFRWAVRRLSEFLGCEPTAEAVLAARRDLPPDDLARRLFADAGIETLLVDYGFRGEENLSLEELGAATGCRVEPILRLETLAEELIREHASFSAFLDAFVDRIERARSDGHVALKSIVAYRTGLAIAPPEEDAAVEGFRRLRSQVERGEGIRLAHKPLCDRLVLLALDIAQRQEMPVQFHAGFGDRDVDLLQANPLHLRWVLQSGRYSRVPIVILHAGYPYVRETAYLASVYAHVFADMSLAVPFAAGDIPAVLDELLGLAPISKVLYASDAFSIPELFWLAAQLGRRELARALQSLIDAGWLRFDEAEEAAQRILNGNARALYGL